MDDTYPSFLDAPSASQARPRPEVMYSTGEVAALLRCSPETVRRWCRQGVIESMRLTPRGRRFIAADQFMNRGYALRRVLGVNGARTVRFLDDTRRE